MLKSLELENFQSHKKSKIELADFTCIVGRSEAGKTALVRAFEFLFYGNWDKSFITSGEKQCKVTLNLKDGKFFSRTKSEKTNSASIFDGTREFNYSAFGNTIPDLGSVARIQKIKLNEKEISLNVSKQTDPLFLLSESASTKSYWVGHLYSANIFNTILKSLNYKKKELQSKSKFLNERLVALNSQITAIKNVEQRKILIESLSHNIKKHTELSFMLNEKKNIEFEYVKLNKKSELIRYDFDKLNKKLTIFKRLKQAFDLKQKTESDMLQVNVKLIDVTKKIQEKYDNLKNTIQYIGKCPVCVSDIKNNVDEVVNGFLRLFK